MVDVGRLIRDARRRADISQTELARRAGVTQPVISAYERGRREPSVPMLAKLVTASGHRLRIDLLDGDAPFRLPDTPMGRRLRRHRRDIIEVAGRHGASNVRIFGSTARGTDGPTSDVDVLVDLQDGVGMVRLIALEQQLSEILGRKVDVVPAQNLKAGVAASALTEAVPL